MDRGSIALEIWYLYSRTYEGGDECLDQIHIDELLQIRSELEDAVGECCF